MFNLFKFSACNDGEYFSPNGCMHCKGHCKDGSTCNKLTGYCDGGCENNWTGEYCQSGLKLFEDFLKYSKDIR